MVHPIYAYAKNACLQKLFTWHPFEEERDVAAWTAMNHDMFRALKDGKLFLLMESTPSLTNWQPVSKLKKPRF